MASPSGQPLQIVTLKNGERKLAQCLAYGHSPSVAEAVMDIPSLKDALIAAFTKAICQECNTLCRKSDGTTSLFRRIPVTSLASNTWETFVEELQSKAPTLLNLFTTIASFNDHRNKIKTGDSHLPGICSAVAVLMKERNREMCGLQSVISLLMYACHCEKQVFIIMYVTMKISLIPMNTKQVFSRLNHLNLCMSYPATLKLADELSETHTVPLLRWIKEGVVIKFWGDNVDTQQKVRDERSDNSARMLHMFSVIVGCSRTPAPELPHTGGSLSNLELFLNDNFVPNQSDINRVQENLVDIVSRTLTEHITGLAPFAKVVPKHILHRYSKEMACKSKVYTLDVMMKNEAKHDEMIDIMRTLQNYLGKDYSEERKVACGGDQLTCERQVGAQRLTSCADCSADRLELLEPVSEDWHCLVILLKVAMYVFQQSFS